MLKSVVLIPAAGLGTRMGGVRKPFLELDGVPVLNLTLRKFLSSPLISAAYVALRPEDRVTLTEQFEKPVVIVDGGANRQASVENCLRAVPADTDLVAVHDAVRPFVEMDAIARVLAEAARTGAAILGIPAVDTIKQVERIDDHAVIRATLKREIIVLAQTPQVFRYDLLCRAYEAARQDEFIGTDEASLIEHLGVEVSVVMGSDRNIKITRPSDLELARWIQRQS
jgi:2-C-methyl-D-erythritol 4-phosphate cytidylyltransferase